MSHKIQRKMKLCLVAGARPNFMKIAPLIRAINEYNRMSKRRRPKIEFVLVHTGQHYDDKMSKVFFDEFDLPEPDYFLSAGPGSHAEQTAKVMVEFEKVCLREKPDIAVVVGDVNSTLACSIAAKKLNIKVAHVEAGLRSGDMTMPEEINRIVTDSISDYLFVTEKSGIKNLRREGKDDGQVHFVGNIMIDTLHYSLKKLASLQTDRRVSSNYAVCTLHRPSNVDDKEKLKDILKAVAKISENMAIYFPMHPRTEKNINTFGLKPLIEVSGIKTMPPKSYLEFLALWKNASLVLTDSGGIQEETTALGIPCFTIRENTERPITVKVGTNVLVGTTGSGIRKAYSLFKKGLKKKGSVPELWDGKAAKRIVKIFSKNLRA